MSVISNGLPPRPFTKPVINAGSFIEIPYQSVDSALNAVSLSALRYRIDNLTDGVRILNWTSVDTPGQSGTITIPASLNVMTRDWRERELRQVLIEMTDTSGNVSQLTRYYEIVAVMIGAA